MKKVKHSKYKNTAILFELLVHQLTSDTLNGVDNPKALPIIRKYFKEGTELASELSLYQTLIEQKMTSEVRSAYLIDAVVTAKNKLSKGALRRQKYNLIKEIAEAYSTDEFFATRIKNYQLLASAYKLMEYDSNDNPTELTRSRIRIMEHMMRKDSTLNEASQIEKFSKQGKDIRLVAYRILLEKFNKKFNGLNLSQKKLLKEYITHISNDTELKTYVDAEALRLEKKLAPYAHRVKDTVTRVKLEEVVGLLETVRSSRRVRDWHIVSLLRYQELLSELQNIRGTK